MRQGTIAIAAAVAVTPDNHPPNGSQYGTDGSVAIIWDNDRISLKIEARPGRQPTFDLRPRTPDHDDCSSYPRRRAFLHLHHQEVRQMLIDTAPGD